MYCVSCKKIYCKKNSSIRETKQNIIMLLSNCAICSKKELTFIENKKLHNFNNISND